MSERCHTYRGVHIPGCMGCAVYGHRLGCTCRPRSVDDEIEKLSRRLERIERILVSASDTERGETT